MVIEQIGSFKTKYLNVITYTQRLPIIAWKFVRVITVTLSEQQSQGICHHVCILTKLSSREFVRKISFMDQG